MLFVEVRFLVFFAVVFSVHWALRSHRLRKLWLFAASCVFYGAWQLWFLGLMIFSTVVDYLAGRGVGCATTGFQRRAWLGFSLVANLGLLCFFKYYNFAVESLREAAGLFGLGMRDMRLDIVLPVGISFYTFQTMSYTLDVYFRRLEPVRKPLDLGVFVTFFPQLVAGPIVRAVTFLPQLVEPRRWADVRVRAALSAFLIGFIKKACVSDNIAPFVDQIFAAPEKYGSLGTWLGMALFHVQVYCDFSGYSDMAIGLAGLLGYELPKNFDFPYFTRSMTRFWQHWHITLGRWFVDYVYIPMGGNRGSSARTLWNVFTILFLSGIWHGSSWNFVIWGSLHGLFMVLERAGLADWLERRPAWVGHLWVHFVWFFTLTLFRTNDLASGFAYMRSLFLPFGLPDASTSLSPRLWLLVAGFLGVHALMWKQQILPRIERLPDWAFALAFGAFVALVLPWVATDASPFIYFQF